MKVASRFPVKGDPWLLGLVISFHLLLGLFLLLDQWHGGWSIVALIFIGISMGISIKHQQKISRADDDLCWTGENWVMQTGKRQSVVYFQLMPSSWVSGWASLLHLKAEGKDYRWLFSKSQLGERLYSELVYLVLQNIKAERKAAQQKPTNLS